VEQGLRAILFDWGDTLVHFPGITTDEQTHLACLQACFDELSSERKRECFSGLGLGWERFLEIYRAIGAEQIAASRDTSREHRLEERFSRVLRQAGCACEHSDEELDAIVRTLGRHLLSRTRPVDGAREVLTRLRQHYRIGLVSNYPFPPIVLESLERYELLPFLEMVVISGQVGWVKPHERLFRQALDALGVEPAAALMVGDDLANDVRGAKAAGLRTAWLAPSVTVADDPAVDFHLRRLPELLEHVPARPMN
jgi:HAD superfamily hydrolase (TIGR01509 family)